MYSLYFMILSFDLIAKEFRVVHIPRSVCDATKLYYLSISKRGESLVLLVPNSTEIVLFCIHDKPHARC